MNENEYKKTLDELERLKQSRLKEKSIGESIECIPFAWRNKILKVRKKTPKALKKLYFT